VRAPIGGKSGNLHVHVGDLVKASDPTNPLVTINQIHPIRVRFNVPQSDLPALQRGRQRAMRVDVAPADRDSTWIEGRLTFVDNQVDANSGTLLLKGEFANREDELWPGQFVRVRLRLDEQADATVVPAVAVSSSQSGPYLFVVKADTTVETRPVQLGRTWRDWVVIAGGVEPGETVVTDGQLRLSPGSKAMIRSTAANPGSRPQ
jgi:multidrug efflux system membrane fusion protein